MGNVANGRSTASHDLPAPTRPLRRTSSGRFVCGLSVEEVLCTPSLAGGRVLAGVAGVGRVVESLDIIEAADVLPWAEPGTLLLTTGYALRQPDERLVDLIAQLSAQGVAGLGVRFENYESPWPPAALNAAEARDFPLIGIPDDISWEQITAGVLTTVLERQAALLARTDTVHQRLVQVVLEGGGLPEVTDEMAALLDAVVLATTPDGRVLAESGHPLAVRAVRSWSGFDEIGRVHLDRGVAATTPAEMAAPGAARIVVPVVAGDVDHGRLVAFRTSHAFVDADVVALERAATVAALVITQASAIAAVEEKYRGDFLRDLVSGRAGEPAGALTHSASLGWDIARAVVVVVAELDVRPAPAIVDGPAQRPIQERFARAWEAAVHDRDPGAAVAGFNHEVVALLGVPPGGDVTSLVAELVAEVMPEAGGRPFSTGVSRIADEIGGLPAAYEHARKALLVGRRTRGPGTVAHFDSLGIFRLLSLIENTAELADFVAETLGPLAARDDAEMLDLRRTLQVLLETNLNVAETARSLHFHYNTLRYRIGKLERLVGPFTTDPHLRLNLLLALQVAQMPGL
jgi:purine catabolism regulator